MIWENQRRARHSKQPSHLVEFLSNVSGTTPLMLAAFWGNVGAAQLCLEAHADISYTNDYNRSALTLAAMRGHTEMVAMLLAARADVGGIDAWGRRASCWADRRGYNHIAKLLRESGDEEGGFCARLACLRRLLQNCVDRIPAASCTARRFVNPQIKGCLPWA